MLYRHEQKAHHNFPGGFSGIDCCAVSVGLGVRLLRTAAKVFKIDCTDSIEIRRVPHFGYCGDPASCCSSGTTRVT